MYPLPIVMLTATSREPHAHKKWHVGASHTATVFSPNTLTPNVNEKPDFDREFNSDRGFTSTALSDGRTFLPNDGRTIMLEDSGAKEHFVNDALVSELNDNVLHYTVLDEPKPIRAGGKQALLGGATGFLPGIIIDKTVAKYDIGIPSMFASGLPGRSPRFVHFQFSCGK